MTDYFIALNWMNDHLSLSGYRWYIADNTESLYTPYEPLRISELHNANIQYVRINDYIYVRINDVLNHKISIERDNKLNTLLM